MLLEMVRQKLLPKAADSSPAEHFFHAALRAALKTLRLISDLRTSDAEHAHGAACKITVNFNAMTTWNSDSSLSK